MAVKIEHRWDEPDAPNSVVRAEFDRPLTEREANEIGQVVAAVHERHEAARDFATNDPHHARHVGKAETKRMVTVIADVDEDGKPIKLEGIAQFTSTFAGACRDCGRAYASSNTDHSHYVCPSLPPEIHPFARFRETACHEGCAIDCGRDGTGTPIRKAS